MHKTFTSTKRLTIGDSVNAGLIADAFAEVDEASNRWVYEQIRERGEFDYEMIDEVHTFESKTDKFVIVNRRVRVLSSRTRRVSQLRAVSPD